MENKNSIEILEELNAGMFCNIELPVTNSLKSNVTAMYMGKDKEGRYNFYDGGGACGTFKMTAQFIRDKDIKITKQFDEEKTYDLYVKLNEKTQRFKSRER
mgnify:CR=1 FL=1